MSEKNINQLKFEIGRFPSLLENLPLKTFLYTNKGTNTNLPSIIATIEKIQENCEHSQKSSFIIGNRLKIENTKCSLCGKPLE